MVSAVRPSSRRTVCGLNSQQIICSAIHDTDIDIDIDSTRLLMALLYFVHSH